MEGGSGSSAQELITVGLNCSKEYLKQTLGKAF